MIDKEASCLRYVLSAGRTGTVFLTRLLNSASGIAAAHEPDSSRYQMMLANLRNEWGIGGNILKWVFERSRRRRLAAAGGNVYVEINPFLCPMADLLPAPGYRLRIVHMVRDPATWAQSILAHKASDAFRSVIDYVPFGRPYPPQKPAGWCELDSYERALWRWRWCNSRIDELKTSAECFDLVRYEDLFADQVRTRTAALRTIVDTFGLSAKLDPSGMDERVNSSGPIEQSINRAAASRICGLLASTYGYDY